MRTYTDVYTTFQNDRSMRSHLISSRSITPCHGSPEAYKEPPGPNPAHRLDLRPARRDHKHGGPSGTVAWSCPHRSDLLFNIHLRRSMVREEDQQGPIEAFCQLRLDRSDHRMDRVRHGALGRRESIGHRAYTDRHVLSLGNNDLRPSIPSRSRSTGCSDEEQLRPVLHDQHGHRLCSRPRNAWTCKTYCDDTGERDRIHDIIVLVCEIHPAETKAGTSRCSIKPPTGSTCPKEKALRSGEAPPAYSPITLTRTRFRLLPSNSP